MSNERCGATMKHGAVPCARHKGHDGMHRARGFDGGATWPADGTLNENPAQRILIAERCRAMLDALASNAPNVLAGETGHEPAQMAFAYLVNARVDVDRALRYMREQPASTATAAHACSACGRHPDTHKTAWDSGKYSPACGACGLGDAK